MTMEILTGSGGGGDSVLFARYTGGDSVLVNKKEWGDSVRGEFCPTLVLKVYHYITEGCQSATATLTGCHRDLQDYRDTVRKGLLDRALWKRANHCMVHASTVWAFIGSICFHCCDII